MVLNIDIYIQHILHIYIFRYLYIITDSDFPSVTTRGQLNLYTCTDILNHSLVWYTIKSIRWDVILISQVTVKKPDKGDERQKFSLDDRINRFNLALHELLIWSIKTWHVTFICAPMEINVTFWLFLSWMKSANKMVVSNRSYKCNNIECNKRITNKGFLVSHPTKPI